MSDYNSSLPVRTQTNGDVAAKIVDGTLVSQALAVDAAGLIGIKVNDRNGIGIDSQTITASQWLQVVMPGNGPASPGTASAFSVLMGGIFNTVLPTLTNGQQSSLQLDSNGRLLVDASFTNTDNHNYGVVGTQTLRVASQIGNITGAADFGAGAATAQTLRVTVSNFPNTLDTNYGTVGANTLRTASEIGNATGGADFDWGTVGAQTLRVASEIGNAIGLADFNAGSTGAQTLRVTANQGVPNTIANRWPVQGTDGTNSQLYTAAGEAKVIVTSPLPSGSNLIGAVNIDVGGVLVSPTNPVPVTIEPAPGTHIDDYKQAVAIAASATDNHDYTVTAGKTLYLNQIEGSASGKAKMEVEIETGVATGVFNTKFVQFNSTAETNMTIHLDDAIIVAAGVRVRVVMTNRDLAAEDLYSTICGYEV